MPAEEEVEESKAIISIQLETLAPELMIKEAIQEGAYPGEALGRPHLCTPESMAR